MRLPLELKRVAQTGLVGLVLAALYAFLAPEWYSARLSVMTPKRSASGALASQMSELRDLAPALPGVGSNDADRVAAVLQSDSVADAVIAKFNLQERYGKKYLEHARDELRKHCAVQVLTKGDIVVLTCEDKDPKLAQAMAAFFGEHGNEVFRRVGRSSASEEVRFLEEHLETLRAESRKAQQALRDFEVQNHVVDIDEQAKSVVTMLAQLRSQQIAKELDLSYATGFASREEASTRQLRRVLAVLAEKEKSLEQPDPKAGAQLFPAALAVPDLRGKLTELQLDRKFYEQAELLALSQLEGARGNEARDVSTFQVLDAPTLPQYRSRPRRLMALLIGLALGLLAGAAWMYGPRYVSGLLQEEP
jgi:capsule polysaccharide export protein KpsE/RkpR